MLLPFRKVTVEDADYLIGGAGGGDIGDVYLATTSFLATFLSCSGIYIYYIFLPAFKCNKNNVMRGVPRATDAVIWKRIQKSQVRHDSLSHLLPHPLPSPCPCPCPCLHPIRNCGDEEDLFSALMLTMLHCSGAL